jgi:thiamine biosynthesis lipoprotein
MGSTWSVTLTRDAGFEGVDLAALQTEVQALLDGIDGAMSTWSPDSELSRFNAAPAGAGVELSQVTWDVLDLALEMCAETDGIFDPTIAPLLRAYGFAGGDGDGGLDEAEIARLRARVGVELLVDRRPVLDKTVDGVELDFSGIAPGFAVDRICERLNERGFTDHLVDVGGELRVGGQRAGGGPWRLAIEHPEASAERRAHLVVALSDGALATSGDYRNVRIVEGRAVPHIFDPRTGAPMASHVASSSVLAPTAARADALATAMAVLGGPAAVEFASEHAIEVFVIERAPDGALEEYQSPGFERVRVETP